MYLRFNYNYLPISVLLHEDQTCRKFSAKLLSIVDDIRWSGETHWNTNSCDFRKFTVIFYNPKWLKFQSWLECRSFTWLACWIKSLNLPCHLPQWYRHASFLGHVQSHEWERLGKRGSLLPQRVCNFRLRCKHFQHLPAPWQNNHLTSSRFQCRDPFRSSKSPRPRFCSSNKHSKLYLIISKCTRFFIYLTQNTRNPNI